MRNNVTISTNKVTMPLGLCFFREFMYLLNSAKLLHNNYFKLHFPKWIYHNLDNFETEHKNLLSNEISFIELCFFTINISKL